MRLESPGLGLTPGHLSIRRSIRTVETCVQRVYRSSFPSISSPHCPSSNEVGISLISHSNSLLRNFHLGPFCSPICRLVSDSVGLIAGCWQVRGGSRVADLVLVDQALPQPPSALLLPNVPLMTLSRTSIRQSWLSCWRGSRPSMLMGGHQRRI